MRTIKDTEPYKILLRQQVKLESEWDVWAMWQMLGQCQLSELQGCIV